MKSTAIFAIIIVVFVIVNIFLLLVYLYKRRWPLYFTLDNGMNVDNKIFIFLNGTPYNNQALELKKGKKTKII